MDFPKTSKQAAKMVISKAKKDKKNLSAYCLTRGVYPSVIKNWENRDGGYNEAIFQRLMDN